MIIDKIIDIVASYYELSDVEKEDIDANLNLLDICDELDIIEIIMEIEKEYNIVIPDDIIISHETIEELAMYIEEIIKK